MSSAVVVAARRWIGTPYRHQASCRGAGADCLGLVRGSWREVCGPEPVVLPPYTPDWNEARAEESLWLAADAHLERVRVEAARAGTILLFRMRDGLVAKHLGILAEMGPASTFIHAYSGHGVVESPLSAPWRRRIAAAFVFPDRRF